MSGEEVVAFLNNLCPQDRELITLAALRHQLNPGRKAVGFGDLDARC